jgi:DNA modification methylase
MALDIAQYLTSHSLDRNLELFPSASSGKATEVDTVTIHGHKVARYISEFWTSKQRQASSIQEVSYRACFKPQLPHFFIELLTKEGDSVYDPFSGRGTTVIEAGLMGRSVISNDINPLSQILTEARFFIPNLAELKKRLANIRIRKEAKADIDLSMFYHAATEAETVSLRKYLKKRRDSGEEDALDKWIRMVATNRLTGHSKGFFSVYTLPPNQAVSPQSQVEINKKLKQKPEYRDTRKLILRKTRDLLRNVSEKQVHSLRCAGEKAKFLASDARQTNAIRSKSVDLTVTSPPFLDIVDYHQDNWLRCWFNSIDDEEVSKKITMSKTLEGWSGVMLGVFRELFRITRDGGCVAFEVGELRNGKIKLDEDVVPLGLEAGFGCEGIVINSQQFTKTSNIWGIKNNQRGTNTNRIVLFHKS